MRAVDLATFVVNGRYHYDEEVMLNILALSLAVNMAGERWSVAVNAQLCHARSHASTVVIWALPSQTQTFSTLLNSSWWSM